ncbi:DUF1080 domain-containing protein [Candidatus Sumerlaeota bacterium]|nr:DUF1080 domain-containing protein [Candidatus Sumerlaeota bacterium]
MQRDAILTRLFSGQIQRWLVCLVGFTLVTIFYSCTLSDQQTAEDRAVDAYQTEFDNPAELAENWKLETGEWKIENGALIGKAVGTERGVLWLEKPLSGNIQVEYDAVPLDNGWDINCILAGNGHMWSGYEIMVGGYSGSKAGLAICHINQYGSAAKDDLEQLLLSENLRKEQEYHVRIVRTLDSIKVWLDDKLILTDTGVFEHATNKQFFAFTTWDNRVAYKNLKIQKIESKK